MIVPQREAPMTANSVLRSVSISSASDSSIRPKRLTPMPA